VLPIEPLYNTHELCVLLPAKLTTLRSLLH
jgi:hypothetical protein